MRIKQVYVCDFCGLESQNKDEIKLCEAKHIGLHSIEEAKEYDALKSAVSYFSSVVYSTNNEETRTAYDKAIENQLAFEAEHNMPH